MHMILPASSPCSPERDTLRRRKTRTLQRTALATVSKSSPRTASLNITGGDFGRAARGSAGMGGRRLRTHAHVGSGGMIGDRVRAFHPQPRVTLNPPLHPARRNAIRRLGAILSPE